MTYTTMLAVASVVLTSLLHHSTLISKPEVQVLLFGTTKKSKAFLISAILMALTSLEAILGDTNMSIWPIKMTITIVTTSMILIQVTIIEMTITSMPWKLPMFKNYLRWCHGYARCHRIYIMCTILTMPRKLHNHI